MVPVMWLHRNDDAESHDSSTWFRWVSGFGQRLAFATPERAGPPYGASPKGVVRGHREAMSPDPSANALLGR